MNCPCTDCICVAICRHKEYFILFHECRLLHDWRQSYATTSYDMLGILHASFTNEVINTYRNAIQDVLKPTKWGVDENSKGFLEIR